MGVFWRKSEDVVQWVCSGENQRVQSSGCALEGMRGGGPVGVCWRKSEGAVQWVCSGGNQRVWSIGCVLKESGGAVE